MIQGSPEWFAARLGKVTASRIADVTARTKTGWGASRQNIMATLIAERLTGEPQETYTNKEMQWGTDTEPQARDAYEFFADVDVVQVGFVDHPKLSDSGASPDGLVGEVGLVEIKCPNTATHLDFLLGEKIPEKYLKQMQWQMACTNRQWCDFVCFDPRVPPRMRLHIERVKRNEVMIETLTADVEVFLREMHTKLRALAAKFDREAA